MTSTSRSVPSAPPTLRPSRLSARAPGRPSARAAAGLAALLALTAGIAAAGPASGAHAATADTNAKVVVGLRLEPTDLDIRTTSGAALDQVLIPNVYQALTSRSQSGAITPGLASSWKVSSDGLTYTFTLSKGETFSNGDTLDAADAAWSVNDLITSKGVDYADLAKVKSVTATGDQTVEIDLTGRDPDLLYALSGRAGVVLDQKATNDLKTTAIGSGPYTLQTWKQGDSLTLARNDSYWGTKAKVATVVFQYYTDSTAANNAALSGDLDALTAVDAVQKKRFQADDDLTLKSGTAPDKFVLAFNNATGPTSKLKVRQAIRYAIDHKSIVAAGRGSSLALGGPIAEGDPGYQDLTKLYPYSVTKAKALLKSAGYAKGLKLTLTVPSFYGTTDTDLLTSQLAKAGITLTVNSVEFSTWLTDVYTNKDYQLSLVDHAEARDFGNWANPEYYFGYDNATVQKLYTEATSASSTKIEAADLAKAARIVSQDAAGDWLSQSVSLVSVRKGITGFPVNGTSTRLDLGTLAVSK